MLQDDINKIRRFPECGDGGRIDHKGWDPIENPGRASEPNPSRELLVK
jgi:hypothetical protein